MGCGGAREDGQAMVETAIVMPLYVFLILGLLQLGLMHQARLLTKYAAYQAVRAGALHDADVGEMEKAALGVLLPLASSKGSRPNEVIQKIDSGTSYVTKWHEYYTIRHNLVTGGMPIAEVRICGPLQSDFGKSKGEIDFDDPQFDTPTMGKRDNAHWKINQKTKLRAQVTLHYRMPIPFANAVLERLLWGMQVPAVLRMGSKVATMPTPPVGPNFVKYAGLAHSGIYVIPIRANYTMRMQSNIYLGNLPKKNRCVVPWSFKK